MRRMQVSRRNFFVFVEGTNIDGYVHGKNCDIALEELGIDYEIVPAACLPGDGSGKSRLLTYYETLNNKGALISRFADQTTVSVFFMDKDVDDHKGSTIISDHIIYTEYYDVENHVFAEGDVATAVSVGCSLSPRWARQAFGDRGKWQQQMSALWMSWVKLCFASNLLAIRNESNYGRPSPLNSPYHYPPAADLVLAMEIQSHKGARSADGNCRSWCAARATVDGLYLNGRWDEVFKGKWYAEILASHVREIAPTPIDRKALATVLLKQVAATMTFGSSWCREVQNRVRGLSRYLTDV